MRSHRRVHAMIPIVAMSMSAVLLLSAEVRATLAWDCVLSVTTDYSVSGQVSSVDVVPPWSVDTGVAGVHSDADARYHDGLVYVVNHLYGDNIQVLDPELGFATIRQFSVGPGSNPQDIVFASSSRAYVSRYESTWLYEVDPTAGTVTDSVDLSTFADADGIPEMAGMALLDDLLFVAIQRIDRALYWTPVPPSYLAVVDTDTNELIDVDPGTPGIQGIELTGTNPYTEVLVDELEGVIYVGESGHWGVLDGGIEAIDTVALSALGFVSTEAQLGGDLYDFTLPVEGRAHAVVSVSTPDWEQFCVSFDWESGVKLQEVWRPGGYDVMDIETHAGTAQLFLSDRTYTNPGVRVFDARDDAQLTTSPLDVGLPPDDLLVMGDCVTSTEPAAGHELLLGLRAHPNPFSSEGGLELVLSRESHVSVTVYDASGRRVRILRDGSVAAGATRIAWDGRDGKGRPVAGGVYFVRAASGRSARTSRMVLIR